MTVLVQIVDDDYRAQLDQAQANVSGAQAAIAIIEQQKRLQDALINQAEAMIAATQADLTRYHLETVRQQALLATRIAGTAQLTEQAVDNEQHAAATLALNHAQLDQQRQQSNVLDSQETQARATLKAQQAAYDLAAINLGYTRITAPVDGMVGQRQVQNGQYLSVGTQVFTIVPLPHVWVVANYKETQMTRVRLGQPASVTVDAFPGAVLHGHVDSWSPASGAQFSLLPPDNATGNFTKVVQRIPVKIVLDPDPDDRRSAAAGHVGDCHHRHEMTPLRDAADWLPWHRHPREGDTLCDSADKAAQSRPTISVRPLIGTLAVMLGSIISTLDSRISVVRIGRRSRRRTCRIR